MNLSFTPEEEAFAAQVRAWLAAHVEVPPRFESIADEVAFGTRVTYALNRQRRTIDIVGDDEADPGNGSISFSAPLARAMIGGCVGDRLDFNAKAEALEILDIQPLD